MPSVVAVVDGAVGSGLELATQTPQIADDRVIYVHFDEYVPTRMPTTRQNAKP